MDAYLRQHWKWVVFFIVLIGGLSISQWSLLSGADGKGLMVRVVKKHELDTGEKYVFINPEIHARIPEMVAPYHIMVEVINVGHVAIQPEDFTGVIRLGVEDAVIQDVEYGSMPLEMNAKVTFDKNGVDIEPALFNPGDGVICRITTSGGEPELSPSGRVAGASILKSYEIRTDIFTSLNVMHYFCYVMVLVCFFILLFRISLEEEDVYIYIKRKAAIAMFFMLLVSAAFLHMFLNVLDSHSMTSSGWTFIWTLLVTALIAAVLTSRGRE